MILKDRLKALILLNPNSGRQDPTTAATITKIAKSLGWKGKMKIINPSQSPQSLVAKAIKMGTKHIIVCGGDGTVREVLSQIFKNNISIGIVPLGTGNILAKNLGIPLDIEEAVRLAFLGNKRQIDMGEANGHPFVLIAGMGLSVDAMSAPPEIKSKFGTLAYILEGIKHLSKRSRKYELIINGKTQMKVRAKSIMVANIGTTEGDINLVPGAAPQSGDLKIGIVKASNLVSWIELIANALRGEIHKSPSYQLLEGTAIDIIPLKKPQPFECDGDVFKPVSKLIIRIYPRAITVLTPP